MNRWCYCSLVLPKKAEQVRNKWTNKAKTLDAHTQKEEEMFWEHIKMTGFESWLQPTSEGDFMIHCLEGDGSLSQIFQGLREQIALGNSIALKLQRFYQDVLGKDYSKPEAEPRIEKLLDISLPRPMNYVKKGFLFPLLPHKEEEHRQFRRESMGAQRARHEASMKAFGVFHLSSWLQTTPQGKYIIVYSEREADLSEAQILQAKKNMAWQEISALLMSQTGLSQSELSPKVEWLTKGLA